MTFEVSYRVPGTAIDVKIPVSRRSYPHAQPGDVIALAVSDLHGRGAMVRASVR